ncbi:Helix-turn-helix domain-containing protein [Actinopolyspora mzabensis]|uniref:Helix-turn-helix domain-containing protein n=1 Tax=Actinopolyspora mzabensis TaxID=995066 RepID=A0A1G9EH16_ACTMZ|nr:Helix-turn-helix domain-containing protein [Actinopolyspora mzabensis]
MGLLVESRASESRWIERVWRSRSFAAVSMMMSVATSRPELVIWQQHGRVNVAVRGPESKASRAPVPVDTTFFGIVFALGTSMSHLPTSRLVDSSVEIPDTTSASFWLKGGWWSLPTYDNAEAFVARLVSQGVLAADPLVVGVLGGNSPKVSERTLQRRFVAATGLTRGGVRQIDRARQAAALLQEGSSAHDVIDRLGYFDQPHLTRSLKRYVGRSATRLRPAAEPDEPLSLLYKTETWASA